VPSLPLVSLHSSCRRVKALVSSFHSHEHNDDGRRIDGREWTEYTGPSFGIAFTSDHRSDFGSFWSFTHLAQIDTLLQYISSPMLFVS
jgi:hypothetical protein